MLLRRNSPKENPGSQYESNGENGESEEKEDKKPTFWDRLKGIWAKVDLDLNTFLMMMK
jgi:hypothetical protein